jgi:xanthine dehydrogenase iron-sulfur cluster and FAD-binding subunit A
MGAENVEPWLQERARKRYLHTFAWGKDCTWHFVEPADCGCCGFGTPGFVCTECGDWRPSDMPDTDRIHEYVSAEEMAKHDAYYQAITAERQKRWWVSVDKEAWFALPEDQRRALLEKP